jgi:hypothetical protein
MRGASDLPQTLSLPLSLLPIGRLDSDFSTLVLPTPVAL